MSAQPLLFDVPFDVQPLLKWAGGKRWQLPQLSHLWRRHAHRRLVEPFAGALGVALGLRPERALLNDANPHVVNFHRWVQRGLEISIALANDEKTYYRHRARFNDLVASGRGDTAEAASLFFYLNRACFNGLCRFNARGAFNVPFGKYPSITYETDFASHRSALAGWVITHGDFEAVPLNAKDFVYADPPYDASFTAYAAAGFSWDDQVRAARWLARHSGPVVLSNLATPRIVGLYSDLGFTLCFLDAPRRISATGDRTPAREVLATRNVEQQRPA